jgi:hypothetical protein
VRYARSSYMKQTRFVFKGLNPNTPLSTQFSNTLSLFSSLNVTDHVSHPYQKAGGYNSMYFSVCVLYSKLEDSGSGYGLGRHSLSSLSTQFAFVRAALSRLKPSALSKDLSLAFLLSFCPACCTRVRDTQVVVSPLTPDNSPC